MKGFLLPIYKDECMACSRAGEKPGAILGDGPREARLLVVGSAPDHDDHVAGTPFVSWGWHGKHLAWLLAQVGLPVRGTRRTFATACLRSGVGGTIVPPTPEEITACRPWLDQELHGCAAAFRERYPSPLDQQAVLLAGSAAAVSVLDLPPGTPAAELMGHWVSAPRFPEYEDRFFVLYDLHTLDRDLCTRILREEWEEALDRLWMGLRLLGILPEDGDGDPATWPPCEGPKRSGRPCRCNAVFTALMQRPDWGMALPENAHSGEF